MSTDPIGDSQARWLPVADAAAVLGVSDEILRLRMSRQAIGTRVDPDGRVLVRTPYDLTGYVRAGVTSPVAWAAMPEEDDGAGGRRPPMTQLSFRRRTPPLRPRHPS